MSTRPNSLDTNKRFARRTPGSTPPATPVVPRSTTAERAPATEVAPPTSVSHPATPYTVRIPADVAAAWRTRVADAGVNQTDAVTAAFRVLMAMDIDDFTAAVLADKRQRRNKT